MTTRVYCEQGAFRNELYQLQRDGHVELIHFPYEGKIKKKHEKALPSNAKLADLCHVPLAEAHWPLAECKGSGKLDKIRRILGPRTRRDALHVDSAYKSGCAAFLSRDSNHILAKSKELEELLGMRFFHPDAQWEEFLRFVNAR
jgi:hypothetical protein